MVTRKLQTTDSSATMAFNSSLVYIVIAFVLTPLVMAAGPMPHADPSIAFLFRSWSIPRFFDLMIMFGLGLVWAGGIFFTAKAYSLAMASVVAPFEYMTLPINTLWGILLWRQFPSWMTLAGAGLTLVSSLYTLYIGQKDRKVKEVISKEEAVLITEHEIE